MRLLTTLLTFIFSVACFAQKSSDLQVTYQIYMNTELQFSYPAILHARDSVTIFQGKLNERQFGENVAADKQNLLAMAKTRVKQSDDSFLKINHNTKGVLTFDYLGRSIVLVTDVYPEQVWNITDETKSIAGYECIKATTNYRGREWAAWFAPELPVPYGPWKLRGLPGLIFEAQSTDGKYIMQATKIEWVSSDVFEKDFRQFRETQNSEPITYQQFLANQKEFFENLDKQMTSKGTISKTIEAPRSGYELKYEWEE